MLYHLAERNVLDQVAIPELNAQYGYKGKKYVPLNLGAVARNEQSSPLVSPKFGGDQFDRICPISAKNAPNPSFFKPFRENLTTKHANIKKISLNEAITFNKNPSKENDKHTEHSSHKDVEENESRKSSKRRMQKHVRSNSQKQPAKNSGNVLNELYGIDKVDIRVGESGNDEIKKIERMELELKRIKRETLSHNSWGKVNSMFEEIIVTNRIYGKVLREIKELYERKISQLNERVGIHDMRAKDYKNEVGRVKVLYEEQVHKYKSAKLTIKKQELHLEKQKEIIKQLKKRLDDKKTRSHITKTEKSSPKIPIKEDVARIRKSHNGHAKHREKKISMSLENEKVWKHRHRGDTNFTLGEIAKRSNSIVLDDIA